MVTIRARVYVIISICCLMLCTIYVQAGPIKKRKIKKLIKHSHILNDHFTGFALYDLDKQQMIYEYNDDKYFTPASNTKLFTWYTCLKMLGDSVPAIKYVVHNDSLIFWSTGDPAFLHNDLKGVNAYNFLKNNGKKLFFSTEGYTGNFFGDGWAWDDYNDYYQAEITALPIYGNLIEIFAGADGRLRVSPQRFENYLKPDSTFKPESFKVKRDFYSNTFVYPQTTTPQNYRQEIPWKTSTALTVDLLQDTLHKPVTEINLPADSNAKVIYDANADTVYKYMLQNSDNFTAEQLLLVCSSIKFKVLNTDSVINYSKAHFLNDLPDTPQWVDGSGLSRYNLFTPRSIVALLNKILAVKNERVVHELLPAGGASGTLKRAYKTDNGQVFVWAKTGTLSNNYDQSGYLITRKGRRLAFSFMNNNFTEHATVVRDEMVRIMTYIREHY